MDKHHCDKAMTVDQHGKDISALSEARNALTGRLTEMETTLYGAERNGGGFIKDTRETMELVRLGQATMAGQQSTMDAKLTALIERRGGLREIVKTSLPPLLVGAASVIAVILTRAPLPK